MPGSNFPNGFNNGVTIKNVPVIITNPGQTFWVNSVTGSDNYDGTFKRPWATLKYALVSTNGYTHSGDCIMVMPGHAETVTAAGTITCSTAGLAVIGLG